MRFGEPAWLMAIWLAPAALALLLVSFRLRRAAIRRLVDEPLVARMTAVAGAGRWVTRACLLAAAIAMTAVALARPLGAETPRPEPHRGRDVLFVLDVSRSMLAEDLAPNRLERAKLSILDALGALRGDRVGLVVFAGSAALVCPLTTDYGFFRMALDGAGPERVTRGGSLIGDAIRTALAAALEDGDDEGRFRDIVLITDGEDHGSFPVEAAQRAGERGVRIIAVGIGDAQVGTLIPASTGQGGYVMYEGEPVRSRLDSEMLRNVAAASRDGVYVPVETGTVNLDEVYSRLVATSERREMESRPRTRREELFQVFLAVAIALLTIEALLGERGKG